ncbi:MAG: hypothetical protein PUJ25_02295 [Lachnospiraceae bacterium]|nr:hypothetical protein [Lachnospiraceae bacterium]MDD7664418.1 hypothetical protein [Lachnospiraceae bacterium]MDY4165798.1 hypothetical protein [Lachnospiraceae bacterium]
MKNKTIKKISTFAMGIVLAGATVLTPTTKAMANSRYDSVSGTVNGLKCSGSLTINSREAVAETNYAGGGEIYAKATLYSHYNSTKEKHVREDYKAGGTARAVAAINSGIELTDEAYGNHKVKSGAYTWETSTHVTY